MGCWYIKSTLYKRFLNWKKIFQKNKVVTDKTPFFPTGPFCNHHFICLNPIQDQRTYGLSPKTFWIFVLTFLSNWCKILRPYRMLVPNYWTSTNTTPQKNRFFWSNPNKIEVMITSLIEMLELPNFSHMTTSTI